MTVTNIGIVIHSGYIYISNKKRPSSQKTFSESILRRKASLPAAFFSKTFQSIPEIRSLSADCLPSLLDVNVSGVSASQLLGRSVANFFHPLRINVKKLKDHLVLNFVRDEPSLRFFLKFDFSRFQKSAPFPPTVRQASST